jgi:hypothetical protein
MQSFFICKEVDLNILYFGVKQLRFFSILEL